MAKSLRPPFVLNIFLGTVQHFWLSKPKHIDSTALWSTLTSKVLSLVSCCGSTKNRDSTALWSTLTSKVLYCPYFVAVEAQKIGTVQLFGAP